MTGYRATLLFSKHGTLVRLFVTSDVPATALNGYPKEGSGVRQVKTVNEC